MARGYFLGNAVGPTGKSSATSAGTQPTTIFGRVVDIVLDNSKILYNTAGNQLPIGAIKYQDVNTPVNANGEFSYALPALNSIKQYPLVNEIVTIQTGPNPDFQESVGQTVNYYSTILNIWGAPHHNALPTQGVDFNSPIGDGIPELKDINPLFPFPGDILIEGRQGQSVRIGGYATQENKITDSVNNGKPYILISNGQIKTKNGIDHIIEDINEDFNSLYFLSDHKSTLKSANNKRDSYDVVPLKSDEYIGNQVIINGGRLFLNAKEDSAFISAKESVGLNARTLNFDAKDYFCVDSKKIYLGKKARTSSGNEPVVLGTQLQNWLETLLDTLENVGAAMSTAAAVSGGPVSNLVATGPELRAVARSLKAQIKQFQSKKVFTE